MKRDGFVRRGREGGGEVGSGGQGGLLSCQAELGVANTLLLTHCMRIGNQPCGRWRTIQVHVKGEQALFYRELELKVEALRDRS